MAIQVQLRRGTTAQHSSFTGAIAELTYDSDKKALRVHDGSTAGGVIIPNTTEFTTANVVELNSLYFTQARARESISAEGSINYNNSTGVISFTQGNTDTVVEGVTNLFFTEARARTSVSAEGSINYNNATGVFSFTQGNTDTVVEGVSNLFYTNARVDAYINESITSTDVSEGDNLYFTFERARAALVSNTISVGDLTVSGNLFVQGDTVEINTATLTVEDKNILLANGSATGAVADGAGITVDGAQANITYINSIDKWSFNKPIEVSGNSVLTSANTTTHLSEGSNLYYTNTRVDAYINESITTTDVSEGDNLYYTESRSNTAIDNRVTKSFVDNLGIDATTLDGIDSTDFALGTDLTTANVTEETNLYFTFDRARNSLVGNAISVGSLVSAGNVIVNANVIVDDAITANGTITSPFFYSESDATLKENIVPIENALNVINAINGVKFTWKRSQSPGVGVIAQEVEAVLPEIVSTNSSGSKTVSYDSLVAVLIEAVKEQQRQIEELKARL